MNKKKLPKIQEEVWNSAENIISNKILEGTSGRHGTTTQVATRNFTQLQSWSNTGLGDIEASLYLAKKLKLRTTFLLQSKGFWFYSSVIPKLIWKIALWFWRLKPFKSMPFLFFGKNKIQASEKFFVPLLHHSRFFPNLPAFVPEEFN